MRVRSLCGFFAIGVLAALLASAAMAAKTNYVSKAGTRGCAVKC